LPAFRAQTRAELYRDIAQALTKVISYLDRLSESEGAEPLSKGNALKKPKKENKGITFWSTEQLECIESLIEQYNDVLKIKTELRSQFPDLLAKEIDSHLKVYERAGRFHPSTKRKNVEDVTVDSEEEKKSKSGRGKSSTPRGTKGKVVKSPNVVVDSDGENS